MFKHNNNYHLNYVQAYKVKQANAKQLIQKVFFIPNFSGLQYSFQTTHFNTVFSVSL